MATQGAWHRRLPSGRTCAVVGSSGTLLNERLGAVIDAHDVVLRFNNAPVGQFTPIVGSRTSVRVLNTHAAAAIIQQCGTFTLTGACNVAANASCCPTEHVLLNSGRQSIVECYRRVCTNSNAPNLKSLLENHSLVHAFERASHPKLGRITSVMSGAYGMAAAVHLCTERIDVYGFTSLAAAAAATAARGLNASERAKARGRYHYYDHCTHFKTDALDVTAVVMGGRWFTAYSAGKGPGLGQAIIRIHQPANSHSSFADGSGALESGGTLQPCPERSGVASIANTLRRIAEARKPCCADDNPEKGKAGRCAYHADKGLCNEWRAICPVACEVCAICEGHKLRPAYFKLWRRMRNPPLPLFYNLSGTRKMRSLVRQREERLRNVTVFGRRLGTTKTSCTLDSSLQLPASTCTRLIIRADGETAAEREAVLRSLPDALSILPPNGIIRVFDRLDTCERVIETY